MWILTFKSTSILQLCITAVLMFKYHVQSFHWLNLIGAPFHNIPFDIGLKIFRNNESHNIYSNCILTNLKLREA